VGVSSILIAVACGSTKTGGTPPTGASGASGARTALAGSGGSSAGSPSSNAIGGASGAENTGGEAGAGAGSGDHAGAAAIAADVHCEAEPSQCVCVADPTHLQDDTVTCTGSASSFCCADVGAYPGSGACSCQPWACTDNGTRCACGAGSSGTLATCPAARAHCCRNTTIPNCHCGPASDVCGVDEVEAYNCVLDQVPCLGGEERVSSCTGTVEILGSAAGGTGGTGGAGGAGAGAGSGGAGGAGGAGGSSAGGSGGAAGSAGSGPVCTPTKGAASAVLIDDFSDHDNLLAPVGGRTGSWYAFSDGTCTQLSPPYDSTGMPVPISTVGRVGASDGSINTTATGCSIFGVGVGFSLLASGSCPYDASSYSGLSYWAKGTGTVEVQIHTSIPEIVTGDAFFDAPGGTLTDAWAQFSVPFTSLQSDTGNTVFDPKTVLSISFILSTTQGPVSLTLDDIAFDVP
jgi:hypothetical protein